MLMMMMMMMIVSRRHDLRRRRVFEKSVKKGKRSELIWLVCVVEPRKSLCAHNYAHLSSRCDVSWRI